MSLVGLSSCSEERLSVVPGRSEEPVQDETLKICVGGLGGGRGALLSWVPTRAVLILKPMSIVVYTQRDGGVALT
jgi:hypothetical protein